MLVPLKTIALHCGKASKIERQSADRSGDRHRPSSKREGPAGLTARQLAAWVLRSVLYRNHTLDEAFADLAQRDRFRGLEHRDAAFARAIILVALRRLGQIDDILARLLDRPLDEHAPEIRLILITGLTQLLFLGSAPHAAINIAVEQTRRVKGQSHLAGLTNAVLRKASREGARLIAAQDETILNIPEWLRRRWASFWGEDITRRIAAAHLLEPPLDFSVKGDSALWAERLGGIELAPNVIRLHPKGAVENLPFYDEGDWWVQDFAASLPARLLGDVKGLSVADLCAAPGGKTAQLASAGAHVTAVDISRNRLARLASNLARLKLEAHLVEADIKSWQPPELFDAVLLDAPCSATGTIRRNPDLPYLKTEADIEALAGIQRRLLAHAAKLVRPGGILVYCVCSLEPEEGEAQAASFLRESNGFAPAAMPSHPSLAAFATPGGFLRTLPFFEAAEDTGGMDGFFAAAFRRLS